MQKRHLDRKLYFCELADTSREFYLDYLSEYLLGKSKVRILEIGCGEAGNLLPFAEIGCEVVGIDIDSGKIEQAEISFREAGQKGLFICDNFITMKDLNLGKFDIILVHDVIEHIHQQDKLEFMLNIQKFMDDNSIIFFAFPAWQMPFGGHQQICEGFASKLPFIHILSNVIYKAILKFSGESEGKIIELLDIKSCKMSIEKFKLLVDVSNYDIVRKTFWFINPHYKRKFGLKPRKVNVILTIIPYFRNYYTTSVWYLLKIR
ncbi:MAG: class I SAM-dependent methyltransferase [Paludibacteraceae bacterium]|nr:class I SAM-dependent methyltransferase [Paludibacteraceae bacterium]